MQSGIVRMQLFNPFDTSCVLITFKDELFLLTTFTKTFNHCYGLHIRDQF